MGTGPGRGAALLVGLMGAVMALVAVQVGLRRDRLVPGGPRDPGQCADSPAR